jgi:ATP-dependent Clp protease ATP-binding subunit ClpC
MELSTSERIPPAADLTRTLEESEAIASGVGQPVSTTHVLLALFTVPNPARVLLSERNIDENVLLDLLPRGAHERRGAVRTVLRVAEETALRCDTRHINTLHLLVALTKAKDTIGSQLLAGALGPLGPFRNQVMSYLTGVLPRRLRDPINEARDQAREHKKPTRFRVRPVTHRPSDDWVVPRETFIDGDATPAAETPSTRPLPDRAGTYDYDDDIDDDDDDLPLIPEEDEEEAALDAPDWHTPISRAPTLLPTAYDLDKEKFPWLTSLGRNLSSLAQHGLLDAAVGRQAEMEAIIDVLGKRRANNPCLVGEPGVGKTAIAEGLAVKLVSGDADVAPLRGKVIIELDMGRITAGTALRGSFSERMQGLKKDVERARGRVVIFIDEIHTLMGAGASGEGPQDAANELKAALARGGFPCIGSTTLDEYRKFIEADPALERRFVKVLIEEPDDEQAITMLRGAAPLYEAHHGLEADDDAICAAVQLSSRFVHDRKLPGKAIDLLDLAMSRARRDDVARVDRESVARVCADIAKVPLERVLLEDATRFLDMEVTLTDRVVGHERTIAAVSETIRRNYAGFATHRPMGSFLFLGPSGVGKTELAKALADFLYGTDDALLRFDMSEFAEAHTVSRLVGAPPGYIGHDKGGQLTEAVRRRPHAVVLLDEIEKAHPDIMPLLLQVLDEGRLTDSKGRTVTFRHSVVVMTSNLGAAALKKKKSVGFGASSEAPDPDAVKTEARKHFAPELWGRIEDVCVFEHLTRAQLMTIAELFLEEAARSLRTTRNIQLSWGEQVRAQLVDEGGFDDATGARPMRQAVKRLVETPVAEAILRGEIREGDRVTLGVKAGTIVATRKR